MKRKGLIVFSVALLVAAFGASITLQRRMLLRLRANPEIFRDSLYVPSADYVKWITIGYDQLAADLLWLRAIQTFGATYANKENLPPLANYFQAISNLDPKFVPVYSFANMVLGEEAGDHKFGLEVIDQGMVNVPRYYRIPFEGAFFAFWTMDDGQKAKYYVRMAAKAPDCPEWLRGWEAYLDAKQGKYLAAYQKYFGDYSNSVNANDSQMATIRLFNLRRVISEWNKAEIRRKAIEFQAARSHYPSLAELEAGGGLADVTTPDWERLSGAMNFIEVQKRSYPSTTEEQNHFASQFMRTGWPKAPPDPLSSNPHFKSYLIWPGQEPRRVDEKTGAEKDNDLFVISELDAAKILSNLTGMLGTLVADYRKKSGDQTCSDAVHKMYEQYLTDKLRDPWGGEFVWDDAACAPKSSSHPNFVAEYAAAPAF